MEYIIFCRLLNGHFSSNVNTVCVIHFVHNAIFPYSHNVSLALALFLSLCICQPTAILICCGFSCAYFQFRRIFYKRCHFCMDAETDWDIFSCLYLKRRATVNKLMNHIKFIAIFHANYYQTCLTCIVCSECHYNILECYKLKWKQRECLCVCVTKNEGKNRESAKRM